MSSDKKQLILIVVPAIAVAMLLIATSIAIMRKLRRRSQRTLLPTQETPGFTQHHIGSLRNWPQASHQPQRPAKGTWQQFKDRQRQREIKAQECCQPAEEWQHAPKSAAYWRQVGRQMAARRTWWETVKDKIGLLR
jgi:hypothetical protein